MKSRISRLAEMDGRFSLVKLRSAEKPRLKLVATSNSNRRLTLQGNAGRTYAIQSSTSLLHWLPVGTVALDESTTAAELPVSDETSGLFFRALISEP